MISQISCDDNNSNNDHTKSMFTMENNFDKTKSSISSVSTTITSKKQTRHRKNTLRILIHATMQLLSSPPHSPTRSPSETLSSSPVASSDEPSSYISFPEFEAYESSDDESAECMVLQMEEFDEMLVNGVRVLRSSN